MRLVAFSVFAALTVLAAPAEACGTGIWLGGSGTAEPNRQGWVFVEGGAAPGREGERARFGPMFVAGAGTSLFDGDDVSIGSTFMAIVRPTVATAPSTTDLALTVRAATPQFRHGFGVALDAGAFSRVSGTKAVGPMGGITLGAPYGLQASWLVEAPKGSPATHALLFGIDLARR